MNESEIQNMRDEIVIALSGYQDFDKSDACLIEYVNGLSDESVEELFEVLEQGSIKAQGSAERILILKTRYYE